MQLASVQTLVRIDFAVMAEGSVTREFELALLARELRKLEEIWVVLAYELQLGRLAAAKAELRVVVLLAAAVAQMHIVSISHHQQVCGHAHISDMKDFVIAKRSPHDLAGVGASQD